MCLNAFLFPLKATLRCLHVMLLFWIRMVLQEQISLLSLHTAPRSTAQCGLGQGGGVISFWVKLHGRIHSRSTPKVLNCNGNCLENITDLRSQSWHSMKNLLFLLLLCAPSCSKGKPCFLDLFMAGDNCKTFPVLVERPSKSIQAIEEMVF